MSSLGPLVFLQNDTFTLAGIVSFGKDCSLYGSDQNTESLNYYDYAGATPETEGSIIHKNYSGVYTAVTKYVDWIKTKIEHYDCAGRKFNNNV